MPEYNTLADELQRLVDVTDAIGEAIANQGGTVDYYDRLEQYPADIATIGTNIGTKTITDDSTIDFVGNGNPLLEYTIKGNMVQTGTPSPTNIIYPDEVGERTANLFNGLTEQGTIDSTGNQDTNLRIRTVGYIDVSAGYYTISWDGPQGSTCYVMSYDENYDFIRGDGWLTSPYTILIASQVKHIRCVWRNSTQTEVLPSEFTNIMVNVGSTALPYESYCKIPIDINASTVNVQLGEVETTRRIAKYVITGDETITLTEQSGLNRFGIVHPFSTDINRVGICSHYKYEYANANLSCYIATGGSYLYIFDNNYSTSDNFKTYLRQQYVAGTPVTAWYVLSEPTTGIVDEPLRKIGEYVDTVTGPPVAVPTIEGTNTLKVDTSLSPSETFIKYRYIENITLLGEKTITDNGIYDATDDNLDGYTSVTVNVEGNIATKTSSTFPINYVGNGSPFIEINLEGNMSQTGTPSPSNIIMPDECGDRTINLLDFETLKTAPSGSFPGSGTNIDNFLTLQMKPDTTYTCISNGTGSESGVSDLNRSVYFQSPDTTHTVYTGHPVTVTTDSTGTLYVGFCSSRTNAQQYLNGDAQIWFVEGDEVVPYEPYGIYKLPLSIDGNVINEYVNEPLRKIDTYVDTKTLTTETRYIKKIVLTGSASENWQLSSTGLYYNLGLTDDPKSRELVVSSHFTSTNNSVLPVGTIRFGGSTTEPTQPLIVNYDNGAGGVNDFKAWLADQYAAGTPVCVWYVLAEPTTTEVLLSDINTANGQDQFDVLTSLKPSSGTITYHYKENIALLGTKTITEDGIYTATTDNLDGYSAVTVEVTPPINAIVAPADDKLEYALGNGIIPPTPPTPEITPEGTVRFIDYDGTVLHEYPSDIFIFSSSLPDLPEHFEFIPQGWNWTLADAKAYVETHGSLVIGQMYDSSSMTHWTTDGMTSLYVAIREGRLKPYLGLTGNSMGTVVKIDWGDGSPIESVTLNVSTVYTPHEYADVTDNTILISVVSGSITLGGSTSYNSNILRASATPNLNNDFVYQNALLEVEIGENVSIGTYAFSGCRSLRTIYIPDGVTSIGDDAFYNCYSLIAANIPASVTTIGSSAFHKCYSLTTVTLPNTITSIGNSTFYDCTLLKSVTIPDGVTTIGNQAFYGCSSMKFISIPNTVTSIGDYAFYYCTSVTSANIPDSITTLGQSVFNNCYSLETVTIPDNTITALNNHTFYYCYSLKNVNIPDGVTSIGHYVFQNCTSLTSIDIPDGVTSIGNDAFEYCSALRTIDIPDTVTTIGNNVFSYCYALESVNLSDTLTSIGGNAFYNCYSLETIDIPDTVTSIGSAAFQNCYVLKSIYIPYGVTIINSSTFSNCYALSEVDIDDGPTTIGQDAFNNCESLVSIYIPDTVTTIGSSAFRGCQSLMTIYIRDNVTSIGQYAFNNCFALQFAELPEDGSITTLENYLFATCTSLSPFYIPDTVTSIGQYALKDCYSLSSITIPDSVTTIGNGAFQYCYGLGSIKFESTTPPTVYSSTAWTGLPTDCKIYVPTGTLSAYTTATNYPSSSTYTYVEY